MASKPTDCADLGGRIPKKVQHNLFVLDWQARNDFFRGWGITKLEPWGEDWFAHAHSSGGHKRKSFRRG
jgi:hypothetical protein